MCNTEARQVQQTKPDPWYLTELAVDVIEGGLGCLLSMVGKDRNDHFTNRDPFLGSGSL